MAYPSRSSWVSYRPRDAWFLIRLHDQAGSVRTEYLAETEGLTALSAIQLALTRYVLEVAQQRDKRLARPGMTSDERRSTEIFAENVYGVRGYDRQYIWHYAPSGAWDDATQRAIYGYWRDILRFGGEEREVAQQALRVLVRDARARAVSPESVALGLTAAARIDRLTWVPDAPSWRDRHQVEFVVPPNTLCPWWGRALPVPRPRPSGPWLHVRRLTGPQEVRALAASR